MASVDCISKRHVETGGRSLTLVGSIGRQLVHVVELAGKGSLEVGIGGKHALRLCVAALLSQRAEQRLLLLRLFGRAHDLAQDALLIAGVDRARIAEYARGVVGHAEVARPGRDRVRRRGARQQSERGPRGQRGRRWVARCQRACRCLAGKPPDDVERGVGEVVRLDGGGVCLCGRMAAALLRRRPWRAAALGGGRLGLSAASLVHQEGGGGGGDGGGGWSWSSTAM